MKKTDRILQHLAAIPGADRTSEIAAAIGEADDMKGVGALLNYLQNKGRARSRATDTRELEWQITAAGRRWLEELGEEAAEAGEPAPSESVRKRVAKAARERAADSEKLPPAPRRKTNGNGHAVEVAGLRIESGIEIPSSARATRWELISCAMQPGHSVLLATQYEATALCRALRRHDCKFTQRKLADGYRVWRIA